ncbi:hypothetical protein [Streptomyces sp. NPDC019937]|uniref:hypothetical protein n=1 Tax=Streptomyces sp. NPDC019937 TaxID=3154787 RepID=UPI0033DABA52
MSTSPSWLRPGGISLVRGLNTTDPSEAMVKRAAISATRHTVVPADHTQIGHTHFAQFGNLADIDVLITGDRANFHVTRDIERAGPRVLTV